jgi:hypothetical protein
MTTSKNYMAGRKKYSRPQGMLFADNPGRKEVVTNPDTGLVEVHYIPNGYEVGADIPEDTDSNLIDQFIIISDDNRSQIDFTTTRIEKRQRMINGRMRSYHIADKLNISASWEMLPSRSFSTFPNFDLATGKADGAISGSPYVKDTQYTTDGGAGGAELLDWYENHQGSFWVYLSYDKYKNFNTDESPYNQLNKYNQVVEVFFSDFQYSVVKRGGSNHDFWNISLTLEEV